MRHGLIPNLHDGGNNPRFNARDATWFFLQAIKDYVLMSDEGEDFLEQHFELNFYSDNQDEHWWKKNEGQKPRKISILDLILEIVNRHAQGIEFREWNAGSKLTPTCKTKVST